jgi:hypothetical protein
MPHGHQTIKSLRALNFCRRVFHLLTARKKHSFAAVVNQFQRPFGFTAPDFSRFHVEVSCFIRKNLLVLQSDIRCVIGRIAAKGLGWRARQPG